MTDYSTRPWLRSYDPDVPATLVYPDVALHEFLERSAREYPDAPACQSPIRMPDGGWNSRLISYSQINNQTDALATKLITLGLQKGDRVAIILPNCTQFVIAFYAALKAGGVIAATNPLLPPTRLQSQLADSGAMVAITLSAFYETLKNVQQGTALKHIIVTDVGEYLLPSVQQTPERSGGAGVHEHQEDHWLQDILRYNAGQKSHVEVQGSDIALFQYTGGTTGVSKAAVATHAALVANTIQFRTWLSGATAGRPQGEVFLAAIPLFHVFGMVAVMSLAVSMAASLLLIRNPRELGDLLDAIHVFRPTIFMGVPGLYNAINNDARVKRGEVRLSSLRVCISGSAPLPSATKRNFEALSGGTLLEGFGMSEMPTATHINPYAGENRTGSIGLPLPDVECRIVSPEDGETDVPLRQVGELIVRGPQMMLRYHGMFDETANAMRPGKDGKPWFYTGDLATMDEDGYFYIVDRKKDMVLIGGFNVYPRNVEDVLMSHPAVLEAGVAGVPHPDPSRDGQESLKAWVVLKPGELISAVNLSAFAAQELASYEIPTMIEFVDALPKTTVGKTLRRELVRMEMEARDRLGSQGPDEIEGR